MKKIVLFILVCCFLTACASEKETNVSSNNSQTVQPQTEEPKTETETNTPEPTKTVVVPTIELKSEENETQENAITFMMENTTIPIVTIEGNETAAEKMNQYFAERLKEFRDSIKDYPKMAKEQYENLEDKQYFNGYYAEMIASIEDSRVDEKVTSIVEDDSEYTGGVHPNSYKTAANFNTETGELLTLADIAVNEDELKTFLHDFIIKDITNRQTSDSDFLVFDDYKDYIDSILSDNTWYFTKDGIILICNSDIIAPHAMGTIEFLVLYEDLSHLVKEEYLMK